MNVVVGAVHEGAYLVYTSNFLININIEEHFYGKGFQSEKILEDCILLFSVFMSAGSKWFFNCISQNSFCGEIFPFTSLLQFDMMHFVFFLQQRVCVDMKCILQELC